MENLHEYAVIFTYNFDNDSEITLFGDDYDGAVQYLKDSFNEEFRIETEENGWEDDVETWHNDEWTNASITHWVGIDYDVCEYRLCTHVRRASK